MGRGQTRELLKICFQLLSMRFLDGMTEAQEPVESRRRYSLVSLPRWEDQRGLAGFARVFKGRESSDQKLVGGNYMLQDGFFVLFQKMLFLHLGEKIRFLDLSRRRQ